MADVHSGEIRSFNMSRIRGKDTKPEMKVRSFLHRAGFRYQLHAKKLPGRPDLVLTRYNTVVFVHGCFWHCHDDCSYFRLPKSNRKFWKDKLGQNKVRDEANEAKLKEMGWNVIVLWECELRGDNALPTLRNLVVELKSVLKSSDAT